MPSAMCRIHGKQLCRSGCRVDLPDLDGSPANEDIPCNVLAMLKVRDGALHWTQVMRSNDLFLGLPYNIVQFTMLQEVLAGWLGVRVGPYNVVIDSLHVYVDRGPPLRRRRRSGLLTIRMGFVWIGMSPRRLSAS